VTDSALGFELDDGDGEDYPIVVDGQLDHVADRAVIEQYFGNTNPSRSPIRMTRARIPVVGIVTTHVI